MVDNNDYVQKKITNDQWVEDLRVASLTAAICPVGEEGVSLHICVASLALDTNSKQHTYTCMHARQIPLEASLQPPLPLSFCVYI